MTEQPILPSAESSENAEAPGPLSPGQLEQLAGAKQRIKPIFGAVKIATFNFWCFAISAALSLIFVFFYPSGLIVAACLTLAAYNEHRGRRLLRDFEPKGGLILFYNQLGFLVLIFLYCSWRIADCYFSPAPLSEYTQSNSVMSQLFSEKAVSGSERELGELNDLYQTYVILFYALVMALSAVVQGLCALTYYRRYRLLGNFIQQTPRWVLAVLKAAS